MPWSGGRRLPSLMLCLLLLASAASVQASGPAPAAGPGPSWSIVQADADPNSGYEVAAYALDASTAIVVHKRFHDVDPQAEYASGELVALRTTDAGATWNETVIDADSPERWNTLDYTISVDGAGDDVYVLYHERASGFFSDMRLLCAHSADRGATWTTSLVTDGFMGDYNALSVINGSTAVASWHGEGAADGAWAGVTTDGGQTWSSTNVAPGLGNGYYTAVAATGQGGLHAAYQNTAGEPNPVHVLASDDGGATWSDQGFSNPSAHGGMGADLAALSSQDLLFGYEDLWNGSRVDVSASHDGGATWTHQTLQEGDMVGWNLDLEAVGSGQALLSYWWVEGSPGPETGHAQLASTSDGGATWSIETVPEPMYVNPYIDVAAADLDTPFVAYQVWDQATDARTLHIAHRSTPPPPPPPTPRTAVLVDVDLGTLGDHRHVDVAFSLNATFTGLDLTVHCPTSVGEVALVPVGDPLSSIVVACALGDHETGLPTTLPEGDYILQADATGQGHFTVEITGFPTA